MTVSEVLEEIRAKDGSVNRFSKEKFEKLMLAMANDTKFTGLVAQVKGGEYVGDLEVEVSNGFRKWVKSVLEDVGMDKNDAAIVLDPEYKFKNVNGLYDYFAHTLYNFLAAGNKYDLPSQKDFKGSVYIKNNPKKTKKVKARNPQTGEDLGVFEQTTEAYRSLAVTSPCPSYLKDRKKVQG